MIKKLLYLALIGLVVCSSAWFGRKAYRRWSQNRLVNQGRHYLTTADYRKASLCVQRALQINNANAEACRLMADLAETAGSREAVGWRKRVVKLSPNVPQRRLEWSSTALHFGDPAEAEAALDGLRGTNRSTIAFYELAAGIALAANSPSAAESNLLQSVKLDPQNKRNQLNLAALQLKSNRGEARRKLEELSRDPELRRETLHALITNDLNNKEVEDALTWSKQLVVLPDLEISDRLLHLEVLQRAHKPEARDFLAMVQDQAVQAASDVLKVANWMMANQQAAQLLAWLGSLPAEITATPPLQAVRADCYVATQQWAELDKFLGELSWAQFEYVRLAYQAYALQQQGWSQGAKVKWQAAINAASNQLPRLVALLQMTHVFGWENEADDLVWIVVEKFPQEKWAFQALYQKFMAAQNTRALYRLLTTRIEFDPKNPGLRNNLALLSMLLNLQVTQAQAVAKELYQQDPKNSHFNSTYAYSLFLQGEVKKAIATLETLTLEQLREPSIAAYYGTMLIVSGDVAKAKSFLELAAKAPLLPEERAMIEKAKPSG